MRIQFLEKQIRIQVISSKFTNFFNKPEFQFVFFCSLIFKLKLDEPFRNQEIFIIPLFLIVQILALRVNFFFGFLVDILPLGFGSMDPHNFQDPDPRRPNLGDSTDPDPKHCKKKITIMPNTPPFQNVGPSLQVLRSPLTSFYERFLTWQAITPREFQTELTAGASFTACFITLKDFNAKSLNNIYKYYFIIFRTLTIKKGRVSNY